MKADYAEAPHIAHSGVEPARELEQLQQVLHGLLSTLTHDIRTPLSAISGWLFLLDSDKLDIPAKQRALEKIRANVSEQVRLLDDISLLSRGLTGRLQLDKSPLAPLSVLEAAKASIVATAVARSVDLPSTKVSDAGAAVTVLADAGYLQRLLEIMLLHALKTTPAGGAVQTEVDASGGSVEVTITDNGGGIDGADLPWLFNAFSRSEGAPGSVYPGAEVNLLLARTLADIHNGELIAASPGPGKGTTFTLRLQGNDGIKAVVNTSPEK